MGVELNGNIEGSGEQTSANFSSERRLRVDSLSNVEGHHVSDTQGLAFNWVSVDSAAAANDYIIYLQNTSTTRNLYIDIVRVSSANAALWKVWEVTGTAAGSSELTGKNLNLSVGILAEATSRGDGAISGLTTSGSIIASARTVAASSTDIPFDDILILGAEDAIAVEYDTGTGGAAEVLIRGYYLDR